MELSEQKESLRSSDSCWSKPSLIPEIHKQKSWGSQKYILKPCRQVSVKNIDELKQKHVYISASMHHKLLQLFEFFSLKLEVVYLFCPPSAQLHSSCLLFLVCFYCKLSRRRLWYREKSVEGMILVTTAIYLTIISCIDKNADTSLRKERHGAQWLYIN